LNKKLKNKTILITGAAGGLGSALSLLCATVDCNTVMLDVINACWLLSVACLPLLRMSPAGSVYFVLEDMDRMSGAFWGAYGVSKHALKALTSQFAAECMSSGIQVLGINPGPMRTPIRASAYHGEDPGLQAEPAIAATKILEFLSGEREPGSVFVDLQDS